MGLISIKTRKLKGYIRIIKMDMYKEIHKVWTLQALWLISAVAKLVLHLWYTNCIIQSKSLYCMQKLVDPSKCCRNANQDNNYRIGRSLHLVCDENSSYEQSIWRYFFTNVQIREFKDRKLDFLSEHFSCIIDMVKNSKILWSK